MWFGLIQNQDASEFTWYVIHSDNCDFARRQMELLSHTAWGRGGFSTVFSEEEAREMLDDFHQYVIPPPEKGTVQPFWEYKEPKLTPIGEFYEHIGKRLARDLMSVGDEPNHPATRMEYKCRLQDGGERGQGGMDERALARYFTQQLQKYLSED